MTTDVRNSSGVRIGLLGLLLVAFAPALAADQAPASDKQGAADRAARIERLEAAIERQRNALSEDRSTRRAMEEKLDRVRTDLEHTRERQQSLEDRIDRETDGTSGTSEGSDIR